MVQKLLSGDHAALCVLCARDTSTCLFHPHLAYLDIRSHAMGVPRGMQTGCGYSWFETRGIFTYYWKEALKVDLCICITHALSHVTSRPALVSPIEQSLVTIRACTCVYFLSPLNCSNAVGRVINISGLSQARTCTPAYLHAPP